MTAHSSGSGAGSPSAVSDLLFDAWGRGPNPADRQALLATPVPGTVALRARFHFLTDEAVTEGPLAYFGIDRASWDRRIELTAAADAALVAHDLGAAESALDALLASHRPEQHPLPLIDALVAMGESLDKATGSTTPPGTMRRPSSSPREGHYRFGTVRALVSAGLTMQAGSVAQAAETFESAATIVRELDERLYLANALTGLGHALGRLRRDAQAARALRQALELLETL